MIEPIVEASLISQKGRLTINLVGKKVYFLAFTNTEILPKLYQVGTIRCKPRNQSKYSWFNIVKYMSNLENIFQSSMQLPTWTAKSLKTTLQAAACFRDLCRKQCNASQTESKLIVSVVLPFCEVWNECNVHNV